MDDKGINPQYKPKKISSSDANELFNSLLKGDKNALSKSITYVESNDALKRTIGKELVKLAWPHSGKSKRIGITGVPGAGKSTFIEAIGEALLNTGGKLAVLAVDPSSSINKGSILGDKTRMTELSVNPNVFIRPSPAGTELGGVARNTYETILLCEAAGYNHILIETVGVGQSETEVRQLTDFFILLLIAGAGDELQGIKRGIMEMADLILVNKADGNNREAAQKAVKEINNALKFLPGIFPDWNRNVQTFSSLEKTGITELLSIVDKFFNEYYLKNILREYRGRQQKYWFDKYLKKSIYDNYISTNNLINDILSIENKIVNSEISAFEAIDVLLFKKK